MKKSLLALAVLGAFAGVASAQTSITIYGSFDGGIRRVDNANTAGDSRLTMGSGGTYNSNRFGFKGVEDLGGGLNAHFVMEGDFNNGTGAQAGALFGRSSYVGIGGTWGSIDLGRQYTVAFKTIGAYDPFSYKYTSIIPLALADASAGTRNSNDIQYTGSFGPMTVRAEYALGEAVGSTSRDSTAAVGLGYAAGPFAVGAAYTQKKRNLAALPAINDQDYKHFTVGGAYTAGPFRVALGYADGKQQNSTGLSDSRAKNAWIGGSYNFTPAMALTAGYYDTKTVNTANVDGRRKLLIVGGTYALSKRTNFYADIDNARFSGTYTNILPSPVNALAAGQDRQTGISVGINHLF